MKKIGLISDTHGLLRKEAMENLKECDLIIHAGDVGKIEVLEELESISKVVGVKGNCDKDKNLEDLPFSKIININNVNIYIIHDIKTIDIDLKREDIDIVIYGHSHKYDNYEKDGIIYINPGGAGRKRFKLPITIAILKIEDYNKYHVEFINMD
jgi:putative phosphoesterase